MRQPDINILHAVIAALPDDRLRPLLLELLGVVSAAPLANAPSSDEHKPDAAKTTTPAPPAKHAGGRPRGSKNKVVTGARKAAKLAAQPGRESIVRAVANGELTQAAGARQIGCTAKTLGTWVVRYRSEQQEPAAAPTNGEGAAAHAPAAAREPAPQAAKPAPAKRLSSGPAGETPAQRTERLAKHAAAQRARDAVRRQRRDAERAALADQPSLPIGGAGNGDDAARPSISAARPTLTKTIEPDPAEAELAVRLWQAASALNPQNPWRPVASEFGLNAALALDHHRSGTLPPVAAAAITRFVEASAN